MSLTLVILAAGKGSRFGGDKPLAAVGPAGQSLFEYSVHDAFNAGFEHIIFVVNDQQDTSEFSDRLAGYGDKLKIEFVVQTLAAFVNPAVIEFTSNARGKLWGTAHAVLVCRDYISNPFVVINADDYHGCGNFAPIGKYLLENCHDTQACVMPGYKLENTLSRSGGVNRGVCSVDPDGYLETIHEIRNILPGLALSLPIGKSNECELVSNDSIVSMTFWGFVPAIFDILESGFLDFINESSDLLNDEFYIPDTVNHAIQSGALKVKVFQSSEKWMGVTYAEDLAEVRDFIFSLTESGVYPDFKSS